MVSVATARAVTPSHGAAIALLGLVLQAKTSKSAAAHSAAVHGQQEDPPPDCQQLLLRAAQHVGQAERDELHQQHGQPHPAAHLQLAPHKVLDLRGQNWLTRYSLWLELHQITSSLLRRTMRTIRQNRPWRTRSVMHACMTTSAAIATRRHACSSLRTRRCRCLAARPPHHACTPPTPTEAGPPCLPIIWQRQRFTLRQCSFCILLLGHDTPAVPGGPHPGAGLVPSYTARPLTR